MTAVLILGLLLNAIALPVAGRRVWFLFRLITSGQPAPDRVENVTGRLGEALRSQVVEVFGQKKLLKWSVPGAAHFFVFWAFVILGYGLPRGVRRSCFSRNPRVGDPGHRPLGRARLRPGLHRGDGAWSASSTFWWIRLRNAPAEAGPQVAVLRLPPVRRLVHRSFMIFNVIWTMFLFRGAVVRGSATSPTATARSSRTASATCSTDVARALEVLEGRRPAAAHRRDAGLPDLRAELQAPAHLRGAAQRALRSPAEGARRGQAADLARASRSPSTTSRTWTRTPRSASARSRTSPGRGCSTSRPAPSAAAASRSARPGTPRSRSLPSC